MNYYLRPALPADCGSIVNVYRSNIEFLRVHLGKTTVDDAFAAEEMKEMREMGFSTWVIVQKKDNSVQGILEYKSGQEVYLSLLMLSASIQRQGIGRDVYRHFEKSMKEQGCSSIRLDVVTTYSHDVLNFWKSLGFCEKDKTVLQWHDKRNQARTMKKLL